MRLDKSKPLYKLMFSLGLLILYRLLSFVTIPWIDTSSLSLLSSYSFFTYLNEFNGGTLSSLSVTAVGISAYISASIILQLLTFGIPKLEEISKQPGGEKVIKKMTMILGIFLSFFTSIALTIGLNYQAKILTNDSWYVIGTIAIIHSLGSAVAIWVGETITEKGFGNGVSLLIALNIASSLPTKITSIAHQESRAAMFISGIFLLMFLMIIILETTEERIPVQYSARMNSNYIYKTREPYLPIKLNIASVMPIIFATTIFQIASASIELLKINNVPSWVISCITYGSVPYMIISCVFIILFTFFYTAIIFRPEEIASQLQINEGVIPGVRPGSETEKYLSKTILKLNIVSSIYMCITMLIPMICFNLINYNGIQVTSIIILVGVGLEITNKISIEFFTLPSKNIFMIQKPKLRKGII